MKKIVCFITVLIFSISILSPLSVFADVSISGSNVEILSNEQLALGEKIALLELFNDLITNGVNELSIEATGNTVDDYLDYLWTEIVDAYNNPSDNINIENFVNVNTWDALATLHDRVKENGLKYAFDLNTAGVLTSGIFTLADYFLNGEFKGKYEYHPETIDAFRYLASENGNGNVPDPDPNYAPYINLITNFESNGTDMYSLSFRPTSSPIYGWTDRNRSYYSPNAPSYDSWHTGCDIYSLMPITLSVITNGNSVGVSCNWDFAQGYFGNNNTNYYHFNVLFQYISRYNQGYGSTVLDNNSIANPLTNLTFNSLSECLQYLSAHFRQCNIYVDGVLWGDAFPDSGPINPNLNIDGILELFGQNQPVQYYFPDDIEIDYKKLYEVIKTAIDDGTPVSMETINNNQVYNDSHDTFYAPVVYNNYGTNDGNEADFIDSVLDLATIPKFDEAYVRPINEPFTRGVGYAIMGADVIPSDIKFLFGAIFVLLLFVLMINRFFE